MDTQTQELRAMFASFLGEDYDEKKISQVELLQLHLRGAQARLVRQLDEREIKPGTYVDMFNDLLAACFLQIEQVLGQNDFEQLFGGSREEQGGFIDRQEFLRSFRKIRSGPVGLRPERPSPHSAPPPALAPAPAPALVRKFLMPMPCRILVLGASYGSLLATKLLLAGHTAKLVCLPPEAELINREGFRVRMPIRGRDSLVEVDSRRLPGQLSASRPDAVDPAEFDLVALAMQEPQYRSAGVRELVQRIARARVPCMSIMNMPPLPYLSRIPRVNAVGCRNCYTDATVWDDFDPALMTLCSPDPQAGRPPDAPVNVLQVRLPTNFKSARFESDVHTALLRQLAADIEAARYDTGAERIELPVGLKVHDSVFVPLAKWAMLIAGNYRCITRQGMRPIREAVHSDLETTRRVYTWVAELCRVLGAKGEDLVPFEKYAAAALLLTGPSHVARALHGGMQSVERVDRLVQTIAAQNGLRLEVLDEMVGLVDAQLAVNRLTSSGSPNS